MIASPSEMFSYRLGEARRKFVILFVLVLLFFLTLIAFHRQDTIKQVVAAERGPLSETTLVSGLKPLPAKSLKDVRNSTLGFQKVYAINLPGRTDKLDAMKLTASLTGFNFDVIDGIKGEDMLPKSLPGPFKESKGKFNIIGCWRAHMNFARTIVDNRLSSALAFEDDADWDVDFRRQLENFALGSQYILNSIDGPTPHSPYGDDWDLLWLGHCASRIDEADNRRFIIENDPTVTPPKHRVNFGNFPDMSPYDNTTRIVYAATGGVCLYSYALSYRGAQKILFHLSMSLYSRPVDFGIGDLCKQKERNFKCISVFPQMVDSHRGAGTSLKDSDISHTQKDEIRPKGFSFNIVHSTRLNVDHLIDKKMDEIENQWAKEMEPLQGPIRLSLETIDSS